MLLLPLPVRAALGLDDRLVEKIRKVIGMDIGAENDVSAAAAVTPIGATARHEFLATETDAAAPAITGLGKNFYAIDKHMGAFSRGARAKCHCLGRLSSRAAQTARDLAIANSFACAKVASSTISALSGVS